MPWLSWTTSPRRCIENARLFVNPRHWLTWLCSVVFIAVYSKCVILLSRWVTLNAAPYSDHCVLKGLVKDSFCSVLLQIYRHYVMGGLIASTTHYHILWSTATDKRYRRNQVPCAERLRSVQLYPWKTVFFRNWFGWWEHGIIYVRIVNAVIFLFRSFLMVPVPEIWHVCVFPCLGHFLWFLCLRFGTCVYFLV